MKFKSFLTFSIILLTTIVLPQDKQNDKGAFIEKKPGFYNEILNALGDTVEGKADSKLIFKADVAGKNFPKSIDEFKSHWYNEPVSQGRTGTCWSFSTTSFLESEVYRIHNKKVKAFRNVLCLLGISCKSRKIY
jgi:bleomycin hydrolase